MGTHFLTLYKTLTFALFCFGLSAEQETEEKETPENAAASKGRNKTTCGAKSKQASVIEPRRDPDARPQPRTYAF